MRILYHHRTLADGAEGVHIDAMVRAFRALGHEVRVIGLAAASDGRHRAIDKVRSLLPRGAFEIASMASNAPDYVETRTAMARFRPDLLYKRHARNDVAALAAARRLRVPSVLEVNCLYATPRYQQFEPLAMPRMTRRLERRALELADLVVTVSTPLAREARAIAHANIIVMPNGADPDSFDPGKANGHRVRAQYGLGDALTIGWAGILREWHGLELLLHAVTAVPSATLLIVGDGPARAAFERRVEELRLTERVVITGRIAHEQMPDYLAAMDIAVVADERTGIASPMKLLEYMSMRRAVVAPRADNIRDLIDEDVDGLLFAPGDAGDLATTLKRLAHDAKLRATLGARARNKIERERNWRVMAETVLRVAFDAFMAGSIKRSANGAE